MFFYQIIDSTVLNESLLIYSTRKNNKSKSTKINKTLIIYVNFNILDIEFFSFQYLFSLRSIFKRLKILTKNKHGI
jgi:hypothetical protein